MKILITGGCGYIGSNLTKSLLSLGYKVIVVDLCWFGNSLKANKNLKILKKDFRELNKNDLNNVKSVIHLANIANDQSVDLNPSLSWEVNVLGTYLLCNLLMNCKIKHFVYASSGSVYGIKKERKVTEDLSLNPISTYNKTKMTAERIIMSYLKYFRYHIIRPATVCGYSDRLRLDLSVNSLTFNALKNKTINVFGGKQYRPNIHINDMIAVYKHFLKNGHRISSGIFNAGFENLTILDIAKKINNKIDSKIKIKKVQDIRSYRLDSSKLLKTGFKKNLSIDHAIEEIKENFLSNKLIEKPSSYNINYMKNYLKIK